ncbi:histidine kinase dimerization/phospho-acceptor domain-containing protein [Mucilaginibacter sp.]|jgi:signal transduction histidine kinase|uniref:histidine kinase dimerization/phospho-acceptor domain-containing protein n=1 Tax=Mucilaginibacter sp. TaxID=1882438 RepID=UPI0035643BBC
MDERPKLINAEVFSTLKHDIKNQLSNIQLALEGLRYEISDTDADIKLYMDSLVESAKKIDDLLNNIE